MVCSVQARQLQQCRASLWAIVPDQNCQWSELRVKYQPILHPCSLQKCMFCSILAPLLCWIGQVHRVFDDLKGHKEQRFPLHLHEKDLEEDQCHVVVSRRGAILARSWRWRGSISTRGCRGSICGESWRDHKCSAADTNALNDHPSQHLPMLMKLHLPCTMILLHQHCTIAQSTQQTPFTPT